MEMFLAGLGFLHTICWLCMGEFNDLVGSDSEQNFISNVSRDTGVNKTAFVFQIASATKIETSSKKSLQLVKWQGRH